MDLLKSKIGQVRNSVILIINYLEIIQRNVTADTATWEIKKERREIKCIQSVCSVMLLRFIFLSRSMQMITSHVNIYKYNIYKYIKNILCEVMIFVMNDKLTNLKA